jgi:branched-chain amino acid transport system ATP-binding protein
MSMLEIKNLHSGYGKIEVLHDINIKVPDCEIIGVIGRNGAGKSTLLNTISGLVKISRGEIVYDGEKIPSKSHKIVRAGIVQVPEGRRIFPSLSVNENLLMGGYLETQKEMDEAREEVFDLFPILKERLHQQAGTLSGGEQQMLATARALMAHPRILLMDEPSMGLAPVLVEAIFDTIQRINKEGTTILLVEQNALMALSVASRGYVLQTGEIVLQDTAANLNKNPMVQKAYLGMQ